MDEIQEPPPPGRPGEYADGEQQVGPDDLLVIWYRFGRLTEEQFDAVAGALESDFPALKFILVEADGVTAEKGARVIRASSRPEERA
jgi:hypothetical protein